MRLTRENIALSIKAAFGQMLSFFCIVTTVLVLANLGISRFQGTDLVLYAHDLRRILLTALFAVLPILLLALFENTSNGRVSILRIVHFSLTAVFVIGVLLLIEPTGRDFTLVTGIVALVIYSATYSVLYLKDRHLAMKINKQLDKFHSEEM